SGMVAPKELADYYRVADVFVMPSTQEGFGIVFLEAAASGLPLIGGNRDGSLDALADGSLGIGIDPENRTDLALALLQAISGLAPSPAGVQRFCFENFASEVRNLTARLLRSSPVAA